MKYAVADTGSNTIRLAVYEYENGTLTQLYNEAIFANLASYIVNNRLTATGIKAATEAILAHKETVKSFSCPLHVFATAAIRNAENCAEICQELADRTGVLVDVLTGDEEALLSFRGACADFGVSQGVMTDVGGGSSEVILFDKNTPVAFHSVPWGGLKAFCDFVGQGLPDKSQITTIKNAITDVLKHTPSFTGKRTNTLCVVGGSVRAAQKIAQGLLGESTLSLLTVDRLLELISERPDAVREWMTVHIPKRVDTIGPALAIYSAIGHFFSATDILLSDMGIKEGYVLEKLVVPQS